MKTRSAWAWAGGLVLLLVFVAGVVAACGGSSSTTTTAATAGGSGATTATTATTAGTATTASSGTAQTIKIGMMVNLSFPLDVDFQREMDALVPSINDAGGIDVGGQKYKVEIVVADDKGNAETARAAVEKLVNQDKVKFILGDATADGWLSVTEPAGVLVVANTPTPGVLLPQNKLAFNSGFFNTQAPIIWDWFTKNFPKVNTVAGAYIDAAQGHAEADKFQALAKAFNKQVVALEFYPDGTQDFSAIATKISGKNPDAFTTQGGGPVSDALILKSLRSAGYAGQFFNTVPLSPQQIAKVISIQDAQGLVGAVAAVDTADPPATAKQLKDLYIAKYGSWTNPDIGSITTFYCLKAALEKAGSIDPTKVAAVIGSGLTFETANGSATMINRPDMGNDRTVDAVYETRIGQIEGDTSKVLVTISAADGEKAARILFSATKK